MNIDLDYYATVLHAWTYPISRVYDAVARADLSAEVERGEYIATNTNLHHAPPNGRGHVINASKGAQVPQHCFCLFAGLTMVALYAYTLSVCFGQPRGKSAHGPDRSLLASSSAFPPMMLCS